MTGHRKFSEIRPRRRRSTRTITTLAMLRVKRNVTQVQLAEAIGKTQPAVSRIERQDDMHVSTLIEYVDALGGRLRLVASFDDEEVEVIT